MAAGDDEVGRLRARVLEMEAHQWTLDRRIFQLETLAAIAREAGACHDLPAAARLVLNVLSGTFGVVSGVVLLYSEEQGVWELAAARGIPDDTAVPTQAPALERWLAGRPLPQSPTDLAGTELEALCAGMGEVTATVPIHRQGDPVGLIILGETLRGEPLDAADLELCQAIGAAAATLCGDIVSTERFLREQQEQFRIRGMFEQYCAPDVVEILLAEGGAPLGAEHAEQKVITIIMADIRGFTGAVQQAALQQAADVVNDYLTAMNELVFAHGGLMDKFMGDAVLAVFGDPVSHGDDAMRAVQCALGMQQRFAGIMADHAHLELPLGLGIGVTTGRALCGLFGSTRRFQYTVMGPPVNLAARLSSLTHSGEIFIDRYTHERICDRVTATPLPPMWLKGFTTPIPVFRLESGGTDAD